MTKTLTKAAPVRETKSFPLQIKSLDDATGRVTGYLSTFDNVDETGDRVRANAYKRTLANKYAYKAKNNNRYLMPLLWQHNTDQPIGGFLELREDAVGLFFDMEIDLEVQQGRDAYSGLKKGYISQTSIGYDSLQSEYVKEDGKMIRDLLEIRLWEGSIVTFPANVEAVVTSVKSASGKTSWPLADRDEVWDGSSAHNAIVKWASNDDGSIDTGKMKSVHFWYDESAPDKVGSYKLLFCVLKDDKPVAVPRGIFACTGGHGLAVADIPESDVDGVKAKIAKYYKRMAKAFNDDSIISPWENTDKSKVNRMKTKSKKDFNDHYREQVIQDWLYTDFNNLTCALKAALLDMFSIGDEPQNDIETTVLNDGDDSPGFITALKAYVQKGIDLDVSNYLNEIQQQGTGYGSPYYLMSRGKPLQVKEGRAISAANQGHIQDHIKAMHDLADKAMDMMKEHTKAVRTASDDLATRLQGSEPTYASPNEGTPEEGHQEGKATPSQHETRSAQPEHSSEKDTAMNEQELDAAIRLLKSLQGTSVQS